MNLFNALPSHWVINKPADVKQLQKYCPLTCAYWPETCWVSACFCVWSMCQPTRMSTVSCETAEDIRRHQDSGWKDQRCCDLNTVHLLVSAMEQYSPWSWCWRHVGSSVPPEEYIWHFDKAALECPRFQGWTADCSSPSETHSRPHLQYISAGLCIVCNNIAIHVYVMWKYDMDDMATG